MSRWLSPPVRKTRIIDFARGFALAGRRTLEPAGRSARARPASSPGSPEPKEAREADLEELAADDAGGMPVIELHGFTSGMAPGLGAAPDQRC